MPGWSVLELPHQHQAGTQAVTLETSLQETLGDRSVLAHSPVLLPFQKETSLKRGRH